MAGLPRVAGSLQNSGIPGGCLDWLIALIQSHSHARGRGVGEILAGKVPWSKSRLMGQGGSIRVKAKRKDELLAILATRFSDNHNRHKGIHWDDVRLKLESEHAKLESLDQMELSGGEPDVFGYDRKADEFLFVDFSAESPKGRRSLCFDREALDSRKEHKPKNSALDVARSMGIELLTEQQYRDLQKLGEFDTKTSSWVQTPKAIRDLGGALFCDRRYNTVFLYHNGAQSYYAARGFRGMLRV